jgi:hypothetical protein
MHGILCRNVVAVLNELAQVLNTVAEGFAKTLVESIAALLLSRFGASDP